MSYGTARFIKPAASVPVEELIQETFSTSVIAANLAELIRKRQARARAERRAKAAVSEMVKRIGHQEDEVAESLTMRKAISKVLRVVGRKIFQAVARPVLRFAARVAANLVRVVAQSVLRFAIIPALEVGAAFVIANPVTAAVAAAALVGGGGYLLWRNFFSDEASVPSVDTTNVAEQERDIAVGPQAVVPGAQAVPSETRAKSVMDYVQAPIEYAKRLLPSGKFKGFGNDVDAYIKEASARFGIPEDVLRGFIKMEAGWTGNMSPTGAIGTGQFIQPTWDALARTPEGKAIGMTVIGKRFRTPQDPRFDKRINTLATGLLASKNAALLINAGLPVTGENLYMLHNIGPGIIDVMLGRPASPATLKAMQQNGMLKGQSAAQFLAYQKGRFNQAYKDANTGTQVTGDKAIMSQGIAVAPQQKPIVVGSATGSGSAASTAGRADKTIIRGKGKSLIEVS